MTNYYAITSLLCAIATFAMGCIVMFANPRGKPNILFMVLSGTIAYWGFVEFLFRLSPTPEMAHVFISMAFHCGLSLGVAIHFILAFANFNRVLANKATYVVIYAPAALLTWVILFTDWLIWKPVKTYWGWGYIEEPNPAYFIFKGWAALCVLFVMGVAIYHYLKTKERDKKLRAGYLVLSIAIAAPIILLTEMVLPYFGIAFPRLTMPSFALISALVGYGMWRHRLFTLNPAAAAESIINTISDALFLVSMDKTIRLVNQSAQNLLGYESNQLVGQPVDILFAPTQSDKETLFKRGSGFRGLIKTVIKGDVEAFLYTSSGKSIPVSLSGSLIRDLDNDLLGIVCIARDITERRRAQETLRKSEERYRLLVENSPLGIISIDPNGKILDANPKLLDLLSSPSLEATQEINMLTFPPLVESGISADIQECLDGASQLVAEHPYKSKWGKELFLRYYLVSVCNPDGRVDKVQAIVEDITKAREAAEALEKAKEGLEVAVEERTAELRQEIEDRQKAERNLAAEKDRLSVTLSSIADAVLTTDNEGNVVLLNKVAESITSWTSQKATGKPITKVLPLTRTTDGKEPINPVQLVVSNNQVIQFDAPFALTTHEGAERLIAMSGSPIHDYSDNTVGVVLVFSDVTERHKLQEELFRARKLESIGVLAGGIAHDFNNILTGIITNLFVAKMQLDTKSETYELITETERAALKASTLTKQLLTFSKQGAAVKQVTSMKEVIEDSVGFFLSGSNVDYKLEFPEELWKAEVDRGQIDQAVQSIVTNADEAMPDGGTITIIAENLMLDDRGTLPLRVGKYIKLSIHDEGAGIRESDLARIFDPYFSRKEKGAGLGLAAAYAIVKNHEGHVSISSREGEGTTVFIYLPAVIEEESEVADAGQPTRETANDEKEARGKILLMDDEEIIRSSGRKLLKRLGYDVALCINGAQAIEMYAQARDTGEGFDAVIMDLTIPGGMGARETMRRLKKIDPSAKAIVSSGYSTDPVLSNYTEHGFSGMIAKPYKFEELRRTLRSVIEAA